MIAWINGGFVDAQAPALSVLDRGFALGDGLFETMLWDGARIVRLACHMSRLEQSAAALGLPKPPGADAITPIAETLAEKNILQGATASLRLSWSAGPGERGLIRPDVCAPSCVITMNAYAPPATPAAAIVSRIRRNETAPTARHKTFSYLDNVMARREAMANGADEALMLSMRGRLAGAAAANVFVRIADEIVTPPIGDGALPGIMRGALLRKHRFIRIRPILAEDLAKADAMALTNALQGVRDMQTLDGRALSCDLAQRLTLSSPR